MQNSENEENFLERISYSMFRYGFLLYLLSGLASLAGLVGSFLLKRFSWYWGLPFIVCGILFLVVFPLALFLLSVDDWRQKKHVEGTQTKIS